MSTNQNVNKLSAALAAWSKRREERLAPSLLGLALLVAAGAELYDVRRSTTTPKWSEPVTPSTGSVPTSAARSGVPRPFGRGHDTST